MVMERKYGLLLVILPFIWLNQPGLDRISDQKYILVMTLPPNHQCQTEKYLTGTKTCEGIASHRESGAIIALIGVYLAYWCARIRSEADMGRAFSAQSVRGARCKKPICS
jgi:hypothetical protein